MLPRVLECSLIQRPDQRTNIRASKQCGPGWNQQPDAVLHWIGGIDQVMLLHEVEHLEIVFDRAPRRKRHERRAQRDAGGTNDVQGGQDVRTRVTLLQIRQDGIAERLHRGDDEEAAHFGQ